MLKESIDALQENLEKLLERLSRSFFVCATGLKRSTKKKQSIDLDQQLHLSLSSWTSRRCCERSSKKEQEGEKTERSDSSLTSLISW